MSLKVQIQNDLKNAMKSGDKVALESLRSAKAAITVSEKEHRKDATDNDIIKIFSKLVKDRKNSIDLFNAGGRQDLVEKEQSQINVLEAYLPKAMTTEEIISAVKDIISTSGYGKADMGKAIKDFNTKYAGKADGKTVSEIVKSVL